MQAPQLTPADFAPSPSSSPNKRVIAATAVVVVLHVGLLTVALLHPPTLPVRSVEERTITAELLSPAPVAAPVQVPVDSPTPPKPTPPVPHPKPRPKPQVHLKPPPLTTKPAPTAITEPAPPPEPSPPPTAPAQPTAPATPAAPAIGKPTMAISAPKNVSHLDCQMVKTDYPMLSRRRGETGRVIVQFVVGASGKIENVQLRKSSGFSRLDDAALAAVRDSSCRPYMENGQPIRAMTSVPYDFNLDD